MAKNKTAGKSGSETESGVLHTLYVGVIKKLAGFFRNSAIVQFLSSYDEVETYAGDSFFGSQRAECP